MSLVEKATVTCTQYTCTTPPTCLGGANIEHPHPDFVDLPRPIATPLEKTKKQLTRHIGDDALKEIVYQMYRGDFVATLKYTKKDDGTESLAAIFGASSSGKYSQGVAAGPYKSEEALIGEELQNTLVFEDSKEIFTIKTSILNFDRDMYRDFKVGLGPEHTPAFLLRLWHHTLRQHASSLPSGAVVLVLVRLFGAYVSMGDNMLELLVDTVVIAIDCFLLREDFDPNELCHTQLLHVGLYLQSKGMFATAAAIYEVIGRLEYEPRRLAAVHFSAGVAHKRNQDYHRAEASFIKSLKYLTISNDNVVNFGDEKTEVGFTNLLAMYSESRVRSNEDGLVQQAVIAILLMGGYEIPMWKMPHYKSYLKKEYSTPKKARRLITRAVLCGTLAGFRQICLAAKNHLVVREIAGSKVPTAEQSRQLAMQRATSAFHNGGYKPIVKISSCSYCLEDHIDDDSCTLMRCPCTAVVYCKKECQVAHWPEHKKLCVHFQKKKGARKK